MKKVIKIFLRNKAKEIGEGLLLMSKILFIIGSILIALFGVLGVIGYLLALWLGKYDWFWEFSGTEYSEKFIDMAGAGVPFFVMGLMMFGFAYCLIYLFFYVIPKAFIDWVKENWERAKREANYE